MDSMPPKKQRPARRTKRKPASAGKNSSRRGARRKRSAKPGESVLIDVARSVGSTLGTLAARSSQAAERLRSATKKKKKKRS